MATCSPTTMLARAECFNCLTEGQQNLAMIGLLQLWLGKTIPAATLLASAECFNCMSPGQLRLAEIQILCNILGGI